MKVNVDGTSEVNLCCTRLACSISLQYLSVMACSNLTDLSTSLIVFSTCLIFIFLKENYYKLSKEIFHRLMVIILILKLFIFTYYYESDMKCFNHSAPY
jgi:hypothetical protein